MFFWTPRNRIRTKKTYVCRSRFSIVKVTYLISIRVCDKFRGFVSSNVNPMKDGMLQVSKQSFCNCRMSCRWLMQELGQLAYCKKKMSGHMRNKYCKAPITLLNYVLSTKNVLSMSLSMVVVDSGVVTFFAPCMFISVNKSMMYLCWDKKRPVIMGITFMPKKKYSWHMSFKENRLPS